MSFSRLSTLHSGCLRLLLSLIGLGLGCGQRASLEAIPASVPDKLVLYSIDGTKPPEQVPATAETFYEFEVLGKVEITNPTARSALMQAVADGMSRDAPKDETVPGCFWPRHAIRVTYGDSFTDYVICFQCQLLNVHRGSATTSAWTGDQHQPLFNSHLQAAGIPIAP
jgi:hypothetical protein